MPQSNFDIHDELNDPKNFKYCIFHLGLQNATASKRKQKGKFKVWIFLSLWKRVKMCCMVHRPSSDMSNQIPIYEDSSKPQILEMEHLPSRSVLSLPSRSFGKLTHIVAINMMVIRSSLMMSFSSITSALTATWTLQTKILVSIWILPLKIREICLKMTLVLIMSNADQL